MMVMKTPCDIKNELVEAITEVSWVVESGDAHDLQDACDLAHESMDDALALIQQLQDDNAEKDKRIQEHEVERDKLKEALGLMVYQYCVRGDKLDHLYMCAGETAFRVLGLEQYGNTSSLESWLFPECQDKEE
jgi:hypothetical protein